MIIKTLLTRPGPIEDGRQLAWDDFKTVLSFGAH
jgi:hypothetical protein